MSPKNTRLLAILLVVLSLCCFGWSGWRAWSLQEMVRAPATIVRVEVVTPPGKSTVRYLVVAFDVDGLPQERRLQNAMNSPFTYDEGDAIEVVFPTGQPDAVLMNRFGELYGPGLVFGGVLMGFGLVLLLAGASQIEEASPPTA